MRDKEIIGLGQREGGKMNKIFFSGSGGVKSDNMQEYSERKSKRIINIKDMIRENSTVEKERENARLKDEDVKEKRKESRIG